MTRCRVSWIRTLVVLGLIAAAAAPVWAAEPPPAMVTVERLTEILARLEKELAGVDGPLADRLETRLSEASEGLEGIVRRAEQSDALPTAEIVELALALHRLIYVLEDVVQPAVDARRGDTGGLFDDLRAWVDGYVAAATRGMDPREAARFERAAHDLARRLVEHLARTVKVPAAETTRLEQLIERLEALAFRLDGLILRRFRSAESSEP